MVIEGPAAFVAHRGISVTSNAANSVVLGTNDMTAAGTPLYDPGSRTRADTHRPATDRIVYVSTSGTDSNSGRALGLPFLTVDAAIASFGATNGGTVTIAAGAYSVGDLTVRSGRSIIGAGRNATILTYTGTGTAISSSISGTRIYGVRLDGFTLQTTTGAIGVDWDSISNGSIYECNISGFSDRALYLRSAINGGAVYNNFYGCSFLGKGAATTSIGVEVGDSGSNTNTFYGCSSKSSAIGLKVVNSNHVTWNGGSLEANNVGLAVESITSARSDNFICNNTRFENNTVANWKIGETTGAFVRNSFILHPAIVTDPGGNVELGDRIHKHTSLGIVEQSGAVAQASGTYRFERTANGGTELPAFVVSDPVTSVGTPVTIQAETGRTAGYPFRAVRAGTTYWDVDAAGNTRQPAGSYHEMKERASDPVSPAADNLRLYARDNGSGATQMAVKFPSGAVSVLATDGVAQLTQSGIDTQLATKVDKVTGKGLSTEDYTSAEKTKLAGAAVLSGASFTGPWSSRRPRHRGMPPPRRTSTARLWVILAALSLGTTASWPVTSTRCCPRLRSPQRLAWCTCASSRWRSRRWFHPSGCTSTLSAPQWPTVTGRCTTRRGTSSESRRMCPRSIRQRGPRRSTSLPPPSRCPQGRWSMSSM